MKLEELKKYEKWPDHSPQQILRDNQGKALADQIQENKMASFSD